MERREERPRHRPPSNRPVSPGSCPPHPSHASPFPLHEWHRICVTCINDDRTGRRATVMPLPSTVRPTGQQDVSWQQSWLDEYPCDMPSSVPYPHVPLYTLLERAARHHPDHIACTLYGRT